MNDDMTLGELRRKAGEVARMESDLRQARESRNHWKAKCEALESDVVLHNVMLPTDANGATIQPGAQVMHDGRSWVVRSLELGGNGWLLNCWTSDVVPGMGRTVKPELCIATYQRTVEDVLRGLVEVAEDPRGCRLDDGDIQGFADEIRELVWKQAVVFHDAEPTESEER